MFLRGNTFDFAKRTVFHGVEVRISWQNGAYIKSLLLVC